MKIKFNKIKVYDYDFYCERTVDLKLSLWVNTWEGKINHIIITLVFFNIEFIF